MPQTMRWYRIGPRLTGLAMAEPAIPRFCCRSRAQQSEGRDPTICIPRVTRRGQPVKADLARQIVTTHEVPLVWRIGYPAMREPDGFPATIGLFNDMPPVEPKNGASPKEKSPPSEATSQ